MASLPTLVNVILIVLKLRAEEGGEENVQSE